jgi:hypothetical protein
MAGITRNQADAHELISIEPLFTPQTANRSMNRIMRKTIRDVDGWVHEIPREKKLWSSLQLG